MLKGIVGLEKLPGSTGLVVDVSGSMDGVLSKKGETTRMDAAAGLAILLREKAEEFSIATFSDACVELPPRRGFALRDAIVGSQAHSGTYLKRALTKLHEKPEWRELDRADRDYRRAVARRNPAGVDAAGVRGERGPVQARRELRQRMDARRRMVGADRGLHRGGRVGSRRLEVDCDN